MCLSRLVVTFYCRRQALLCTDCAQQQFTQSITCELVKASRNLTDCRCQALLCTVWTHASSIGILHVLVKNGRNLTDCCRQALLFTGCTQQ